MSSEVEEFAGFGFPHSSEVKKVLRQKFGIQKFRRNQLKVINAVLLGYDCFVLMPTGGGKSLCYQLPAILTEGVTVVVSPLKSLIMDQVQKMRSLDIPAAHLSCGITASEEEAIYRELSSGKTDLKLLYVTPEKICSEKNKLSSTLEDLYKNQKLARFVIDEAHCVSDWGHDFRPDYKQLYILREYFPYVAMLILTATATRRVRIDILRQLKIKLPKRFISSFNRPNLKYSVVEKIGDSAIEDIANFIKCQYPKKSGIVYCFSRKDCSILAKCFRKLGLKASAYHAGMTDDNRMTVQNNWMVDKIQLVCATIAFGMGIDKPDVRFVIHYSLPKSLDGYYQESGRAGRDGQLAHCIVYYSVKDVARIRRMLQVNKKPNVLTHNVNLKRMTDYCENFNDCRRSIQLNHFSEDYDRELCIERKEMACDNCLRMIECETEDVTAISTLIVQYVAKTFQFYKHNSMQNLIEIIKDERVDPRLSDKNSKDLYNLKILCKSWKAVDVRRLLKKLLADAYLKEGHRVSTEDIVVDSIEKGSKADDLAQGSKVFLIMSPKPKVFQSSSSSLLSAKLESLEELCYTELVDTCVGMSLSLGISVSAVMNFQALKDMSKQFPTSEEEMKNIPHVTEANFSKYGETLLAITKQYSVKKSEMIKEQNSLDSQPSTSGVSPSILSILRQGRKRKKRRKGKKSTKRFKKFKKS